jgi:DnaJ-class molecular chaperone
MQTDYYETLQISPKAEPDTIHRVYRLLASRLHPDNRETGNADRFQAVHEAYAVLSDPQRRARYDITYHQQRQERWRLVSTGAKAENDFEMEQQVRLTLLESVYAPARRAAPSERGLA